MMKPGGELVLTRKTRTCKATSADPNMTCLRRLDYGDGPTCASPVMKARDASAGSQNIFSTMPRIVRDLSQTLGRLPCAYRMEGQDTELDKSLLEAIKDPLTHAVRNSLDHGHRKPPEVRPGCGQDAGRNPQAAGRARGAAM